jgi:PhoH-like ATPase
VTTLFVLRVINIKKFIIDSNALISNISLLDKYAEQVCVPYPVLSEIDRIKTENSERGFGARNAVRKLKELGDKVEYIIFEELSHSSNYADDQLLDIANAKGYGIITGDYLLQLRAKALGIEVIETDNDNDSDVTYSGVKELFLDKELAQDQEILAKIYENSNDNFLKLVKNQYLLIWDKTKPTYNEDGILVGYELIDKFKWNGEHLAKLKFSPADSRFMGKVKPLNHKQQCLFDLLQNKNITIKLCIGDYGTGKDYSMIANMLQLIENGYFDKMVFVRNIEPLDGSNEVGFLPGDLQEKMNDWLGMVADCVGGQDGLQLLLDKGKIEIQNFSALRGRSFVRSCVFGSESQNFTKKHMELLVSRIGEGSELWLNGDFEQTDHAKYKRDSGIKNLLKLKGHKLFGMVTLDKPERSDTASLARLLRD